MNQKKYFNEAWKHDDITLTPLKFSLSSKKIRNSFEKLLKKNDSVADLGCGAGGNGIFFHKINPKIKYTGIDISKEGLKKAKLINKNSNTVFLQKDLTKDALPKNTYSLVYCSQLIEHITKDVIFIKKIHLSLKPNGKLLIATVLKKKNAVFIYKNSRGEMSLAPDHDNEYTDTNNLFNKLINSGFKIVDYDLTLFKYPLIDIFLKPLMKYLPSPTLNKFVNSSLIMNLRYYLVVPIFGFYNFQLIARKIK